MSLATIGSELGTPDAQRTAKFIISYFLRNAKAADTFVGIARWRLLDEMVHQSIDTTQQALEWLVAKDLLIAEHSSVSGTVYRFNEDNRIKAELFLHEDTLTRRSTKKSPKRQIQPKRN
jgi:hypothetical protein